MCKRLSGQIFVVRRRARRPREMWCSGVLIKFHGFILHDLVGKSNYMIHKCFPRYWSTMKTKTFFVVSIFASGLFLAGCSASSPAPKSNESPTPVVASTTFTPVLDGEASVLHKDISELDLNQQAGRWEIKENQKVVVFLGGSGTLACAPAMSTFKFDAKSSVATINFAQPKPVACTADFTIRPYILDLSPKQNANDFKSLEVCDYTGNCHELKKL